MSNSNRVYKSARGLYLFVRIDFMRNHLPGNESELFGSDCHSLDRRDAHIRMLIVQEDDKTH